MIFAYYNGFPIDHPVIHFYALFILFGALLALFLSNYHAHKDGFDWDFFNSIFLVAFPCGIIGARIWYVVASWQSEFLPVYQSRGFWAGFGNMFAVWNGGLAIQGGALLGILSGVIYAMKRRKGTSVLRIIDYAIPTILIAQAIGRWGNFFNQEVFGHAVSPEAWNFLPSFITNNMQNGNSAMLSGVSLPSGSIAAPLFLIEGVVNLMFYFLLAYGFQALLQKRYVNGDSSFGYFIAYGITRMVLEPLRNPAFIMGTDTVESNHHDYKSFFMAIAFIILGVVLIVLNHIFAHMAKQGKFKNHPTFHSLYIEENEVVTVSASPKKVAVTSEKQANETSSEIDFAKLKEAEEKMKKDSSSSPKGDKK